MKSKKILPGPIVYISTTKDGYFALKKLLEANKKIDLIITLSPEKATNVSDYIDFVPLAKKYAVPYKHVVDINKEFGLFQKLHADAVFVNGWSQIIKKPILSTARYGFVGTHPALLPKNRGRAPIAWHFINNEKYGGVTLFYLDEGCDSGPIIEQMRCVITPNDNALTYYTKITDMGAKLILKNYDKIASGTAISSPQDHRYATYLLRRRPLDSLLVFSNTTREIHNQIRAVSGVYPTAFFKYRGKEYRVMRSLIRKTKRPYGVPGQIIGATKTELRVLTADGIIILAGMLDQHDKPISCSDSFKLGNNINDYK